MKYSLGLMLVIVVVGAIIGMYLPWYAMGISAAIIAYVLGMKTKGSFLIGFAAGFILWVLAAYYTALGHPSTLPSRMASLLPLKGQVSLLYMVTGIIGGLTTGLWVWAGARLRQK
ncbi:hypothetical protein U0R10_00605 [Aquirufa sp. OSTEICH-129V]|uniref:Uncharacterized protein n=1 Tax=Aquirufa avitistagni TaxID=3104728 RepID=A0ABW6DBH9_9BACT